MKRLIFAMVLVAVLVVAGALPAQVPQTTSYQGVLKDDTGAIVPDDDYLITFKIYDVETGGTPLWIETQTVPVQAGILNVILGELVPLDLDFDERYWLGVTIGGGSELVPRTELTGSPYALNAQMVRGTGNLFPSSGYVGIGTLTPSYPLHVVTDDIRGISLDGTAIGSWSLIRINAAGTGSLPGIEFHSQGSLKALTYIGAGFDYRIRMGVDEAFTIEGGTNDVGIGTIDPEEKLDVDGAVRLGNTANTNAGTIRWTGADFEGYDGGTWLSLTSNGGSGSLPPGTAGQTIRHNGADWVASSLLYNDGSKVGVGTTSPLANMEVVGDNIGYHFRLTAPTGVGPALYLNAANKDWVVYGTNPAAGAGDRKFVIRDYSAATDRLTIDENGYVGLSENDPDAPLHLPGGNWDLNGTEGDLKIGDDTYRLKIGVATGGLGAGTVGIRVQGGLEKLVLGAGLAEALWIHNNGAVTIGSDEQTGTLTLYREGITYAMMHAYSNSYGGNLHMFDDVGNPYCFLQADLDGSGGHFGVMRNEAEGGFVVYGNYGGSEDPRVYIGGSARTATFNMDLSGTYSVQLPGESIDRTEITDESGGASNNAYDITGPGLTGSGTIDVLTSRTITVPSDGLVLAIASSQVDINHTFGALSYAEFGVAEDSTAFPVCQDVRIQLDGGLDTGSYGFPVSNHSLFDVGGGGSYTFYYLGREGGGDFRVFDVQLSLVFIPSEYGTVSETLASLGASAEGGTAPVMSIADIEAERRESIAANNARIERELEELRAQVERMQREMEANTQ
ncbi:MAG: hypothetical protein JSV33_13410 [bacterium]|nr:MAG: hypothetical protein JSV33_13410 [bacterium]